MMPWVGAFTGVFMFNRLVGSWLLVVLAGAILAGCVSARMSLNNGAQLRGFNLLQHKHVAWDKPAARRSFSHMAALGGNAVVLVAFLEQHGPGSTMVRRSDAVTIAQLRAAIGYAHEYGLKIIFKPQLLVRGSWAGEIAFHQPQQWQVWFHHYSHEIVRFAHFAAEQGVDGFVIGTELFRASDHVDWSGLIRQVRMQYGGAVTYAAHNVAGVEHFGHWSELDVVALTLYPSLGRSGEREEMQRHIVAVVDKLRQSIQNFHRPLWVLEVGMPSARGASTKPWEWQELKHAGVDLRLQNDALELWLTALDQPWVNGVFIWAWYSDDHAGGSYDTDYTPQHKPAERMIRRYWKS